MLRRILLVLPLLSLCIKSYSQDIEKGYISVGIGVSLPDAVFGAKHLSTKYSGFANPGINYNLTYLYKFTGKWGFTAMVGRQINSVDEKALLDEYSKMNPMYNYVTTTNWSNAYLLVGVTYSIPLNLH